MGMMSGDEMGRFANRRYVGGLRYAPPTLQLLVI
jgi:hypothetical protein